jgi:hypothetical protein
MWYDHRLDASSTAFDRDLQDLQAAAKKAKMTTYDADMTDAHGPAVEIDEDLHSRQASVCNIIVRYVARFAQCWWLA